MAEESLEVSVEKSLPTRRKRREFLYLLSPGDSMLQIVVRIQNRPGALAQILSLLSAHVTLADVHAYDSTEGGAILSGFARNISHSENAKSLENLVMMSPFALACEVSESSDGLLVDSYHTGIETEHGDPLTLFRQDAFNRMFDEMARLFGTGSEVMLLYQGMAIGEMNAQEIVSRIGKDTIVNNMSEIIRMLSISGWGDASLEISGDGSPVIRINDCFECSTRERVRHGCQFVAGMLTGVSNVVLGPGARCTESLCRLRGDDHCEFVLCLPSLDSGGTPVVNP